MFPPFGEIFVPSDGKNDPAMVVLPTPDEPGAYKKLQLNELRRVQRHGTDTTSHQRAPRIHRRASTKKFLLAIKPGCSTADTWQPPLRGFEAVQQAVIDDVPKPSAACTHHYTCAISQPVRCI